MDAELIGSVEIVKTGVDGFRRSAMAAAGIGEEEENAARGG
jgi:hypothetical protein